MTTGEDRLVRVGALEELARSGVRVVSAEGRTIAVFHDEGRTFAVDNRCPHMGFPLHRGTVKDGILTCHWHHAKFDLAGGCAFDPWADDVTSFRVEVRDGDVFVDPRPVQSEDAVAHARRKLAEGLEQNIRLVLAKSVIGLDEVGATRDAVRDAALFGVRNRERGWSSGLSILTALANIVPTLDDKHRRLALYHGVVAVARSTADEPPSFDLDPLQTSERRPERYIDWFRRFIEVRAADAAERTLRTAIRLGLSPQQIGEMVFAACTDHLFLDEGHTLDFANKAFELLDHIGWDHAEEVLPSLVPTLVGAQRMEETPSWRHPVDLAALVADARATLDEAIASADPPRSGWDGHRELAETVLDDHPGTILEAILGLVRDGVPVGELATAVAYAAARRPVHFPVSNDLDDWDTVHHTFTYANAVDQAVRRAPSPLVARGILDAAISVHLERFLNVPKRPLPAPSGEAVTAGDVRDLFDVHGHVDDVGQAVTDLLEDAGAEAVVSLLGRVLLREDVGFHEVQMYEAGLRQHEHLAGRPEADHVLVGVARFLAARFPTVRSAGRTFDIAHRLHRGEEIHGLLEHEEAVSPVG